MPVFSRVFLVFCIFLLSCHLPVYCFFLCCVLTVVIRGGENEAGSLSFQIHAMIHFFTNSRQRDNTQDVVKLRMDIHKGFGHMRNQDGEFLHRFIGGQAPPILSFSEQQENEKDLTLEAVDKWVTD